MEFNNTSSPETVNVITPKYRKLIIPINEGREMSVRFTEQEDGNWVAVLPTNAINDMMKDLPVMFGTGGMKLDSARPLEIREE
jgi:hypothetical protein